MKNIKLILILLLSIFSWIISYGNNLSIKDINFIEIHDLSWNIVYWYDNSTNIINKVWKIESIVDLSTWNDNSYFIVSQINFTNSKFMWKYTIINDSRNPDINNTSYIKKWRYF